MKFYRFSAGLVFLSALTAVPLIAQTRPAGAQPRPVASQTAPSAGSSNGSVPDSKIAVIYSEAFLDSKVGIARFNTLLGTLNKEFQERQNELKALQAKIVALQDELTKLQKDGASTVVPVEQIRAKADTLDQMKKDYQRKGEDGQDRYNKRRGEIFQPLNDDIGLALAAYAKAHNISVIIDGSQVPMVYAADALDITRAFITEFNTKNPATASVAAPK
jgi:Skp family chaperone for outer membrane proteins